MILGRGHDRLYEESDGSILITFKDGEDWNDQLYIFTRTAVVEFMDKGA